MSELIGKSFDGEDMRIPLSDVVKILNDAGVEIDPATIQLVDDPRKQMLEEIREQIEGFRYWTNYEGAVDFLISRTQVEMILDEQEAKL